MSNISEFFGSRAAETPETNNRALARKQKTVRALDPTPSVSSASTLSAEMPRRAAVKMTKPVFAAPLSTNPPAKAARRKANIVLETTSSEPSVSTVPAKKRGRPATIVSQPDATAPDANTTDGPHGLEALGSTAIGKRRSKGHRASETQKAAALAAAANSDIDGQHTVETQTTRAVDSDNGIHHQCETQGGADSVVAQIQYFWRMRQRWHRAEKALILQGKALCRGIVGGDKKEGSDLFDKAADSGDVDEATMLALTPFLLSIKHFASARSKYERELCKMTRKVPAHSFILETRGVGELSFAGIVGEAGDIGSYKSVSALWKRMGLAVIDGRRQMKRTNVEEAELHGYNPSRRSLMWNVGGGLIGGMGRGPRPAPGEDISARDEWTYWQKLFVERCRYECAKDPEKIALATVEKNGEKKESYPLIAQARAKRYVEKRFLRKLYAAWRRETLGASGDPDDEIAPVLMAAE